MEKAPLGGYWDADQLNGVPGKPNERGENSLELLGFLAAAGRIQFLHASRFVCDCSRLQQKFATHDKKILIVLVPHLPNLSLNMATVPIPSMPWLPHRFPWPFST